MSIDYTHCPAKHGLLPNDASGCHCYFVNKGVIDVSANTPYNTTYYHDSNCCSGWVKSRDPSLFSRGFSMNQRGRWNWNTTNTKMFRPNGLVVPNRLPTSTGYKPNIVATGASQSRNIFPNTHSMSKKKLFSYLSRNRRYLNR